MHVVDARNDAEPLPLAAVIVNWNAGDHVVRCLESLLESRPAPAEILVVDNASSDGSPQRAAGFGGVKVLETGSNLGFAGGANAGARASSAPIILFLNPDVRFERDALAALVRAFEDPRVGVAGPELRNPDGTLQNRGIVIDPTGHPVGAETEAVFFVSGCAIAVRRELFDLLGGFDDDYFMFAEDLDLCWRAQLAGRRMAVVPDAVAVHDGGASISGGYLDHGRLSTNVTRLYLRERNTLAAVLTNYGRGRALSVAALRVLMALCEALVFAIRAHPEASRAYFRAFAWIARHAPAVAAKRRLVQGARVISDRQLVGVVPRLVKLDVARSAGIPSLDAPAPRRQGTIEDAPLVSVIVPTRNSEPFVEDCLRSIREQSYPNVELIVVDNHSTDATRGIAAKFADAVLVHGPERSAQVNQGVRHAHGAFVYRVDSDFVLERDVIEQCIRRASEGSDAVVVHNSPDVRVGWIARIRKFEVDMYKYDLSHSSARFVRKDVFERIRGFDEAITAGEDYDFQSRLNAGGYRTGFVKAEALHLGEPTKLLQHLRKYHRYGREFARFTERNGSRQLRFFRPVYVRNWRSFLAHPVRGLEFAAYNVCKYAAGASGYAQARIAERGRRA